MSSPAWLVAASKDVGLKEIVGSRHEPRVVEFFAEAGHPYVKDDETAWCAAFVGAKLAEVGVQGTGKLNARSYLDWGVPLAKPAPGCIVVFKRGSSSWQGHVGFFLEDRGAKILVRGGNQSNSVSDAEYAKSSLLGYRWPEGFALPLGGPATRLPVPRPMLQIGATGEHVEDLQRGLNLFGAQPQLVEDGAFGPKTRLAVVTFQQARLLVGDGFVGPKTWMAFDTEIEALG